MDNSLGMFKLISSGVASIFVCCFGGLDELFGLLVMLVICDVITGIAKASIQHKLSSKKMKVGFIGKLGIFLLIMICSQIDRVYMNAYGHPIRHNDITVYIRSVVILYFSFEEILSLLENLIEIGVPIPRGLYKLLESANVAVNNTSFKWLKDFISKKLGLTISSDDKDVNTDNENIISDEKSETNDES